MTEEIILIRILGVFGVLGSATIMIADWIGWTKNSADADLKYDMDAIALEGPLSSTLGRASFEPQRGLGTRRRYYGGVIGAAAMPFFMLGMGAVFYALLPAGPLLAACAAVPLAIFACLGVMGHGGMAITNEMLDRATAQNVGSDGFAAFAEASRVSIRHWIVPTLICMIAIIVGSTALSLIIWTQDTAYPKYLAFYNLFIVFALMRRGVGMPFAIKRWTAPACVHLFVFLPWLTLTTFLVWNGH